jgi:uncharacterized protein (PEP-CTERM system associated)
MTHPRYRHVLFGLLATTAGCSAAWPVFAGEWDIEPRVSIEERFTDNATSVSDNQESDFITTGSGGIGIEGKGARASVNLNYNLSFDAYANNDQLNGYRHNLLGSGEVEAWEDHLFLDARAAINQQPLSQGGVLTADNRTASGNQTLVTNLGAGATLRQGAGGWADGALSTRVNQTTFSDPDVGGSGTNPGDSTSYQLSAAVDSGYRFTRFQWGLLARTTYESGNGDFRSRQNEYSARTEYVVNRYFSLLGKLGYDKIKDPSVDQSANSGLFWSGGVRVKPGPRTDMSLQYGRRYDGNDITGDLSYEFSPRTRLTASYSVNLETQQQALQRSLNEFTVDPVTGQLIDPRTGLPADPNNLGVDLVDTTARTETFSLGLSGTRGRNDFSLTGRHTQREFGTNGGGDNSYNVSGSFGRRLTLKADARITASYSVNDTQGQSAEDQTFRGTAAYNYDFGDGLTGALRYNYLKREGDSGDDLTENLVSVRISKSF